MLIIKLFTNRSPIAIAVSTEFCGLCRACARERGNGKNGENSHTGTDNLLSCRQRTSAAVYDSLQNSRQH